MSHASYCIKDFEQPSVAADIVVFTIRKTESESYRKLSTATLSVLLVKRKEWPEEGKLALPGGFCCKEETIEETASRKLQEKAGVTGRAPWHCSAICRSWGGMNGVGLFPADTGR